MFSVNDYVVYQYWVCQIYDIKQLDYSEMGFNKDNTYYIMKSVYEKETFFIPINNVDSLREPIAKDEAIRLIDTMPYLETIPKLNDDEYRSVIHHYDCYSYARIAKSIYRKSGTALGKKMSTIDNKYLHMAEKYLCDELGFSLGMSPSDVEIYIRDRLQTSSKHKTA